jgi:hypothetical protein
VSALRVVPSLPEPQYALSRTGEFVVELEDLLRLPFGEPTYEEWLALPQAGIGEGETLLGDPKPVCPDCGGSYFGTVNARGYLLVRSCHGDEDRPSCGARYRARDDEYPGAAYKAVEIIGRFLGYRRRYVMRRATAEDRIATGQVTA